MRAAALALLLILFPAIAGAQTRVFTDSAGRQVTVPTRIERVYAAGPPASVLVFALAPDALIGWTSPFRAAERPFVPQRYAAIPTLGRLTGRGNTANVEVVMAAKPDVIVDYGSINPTYVSLADRVQAQTGIPYVLIDGSFAAMDRAIEMMGDLLGVPARANELRTFADVTLRMVDVARTGEKPPRVYYARGPNGLQLHQRRDHRARGWRECRGVARPGRPGAGVDGAGAGLGSRGDRHHRPELL
jgi:iron complex transport system substrate-binding protein